MLIITGSNFSSWNRLIHCPFEKRKNSAKLEYEELGEEIKVDSHSCTLASGRPSLVEKSFFIIRRRCPGGDEGEIMQRKLKEATGVTPAFSGHLVRDFSASPISLFCIPSAHGTTAGSSPKGLEMNKLAKNVQVKTMVFAPWFPALTAKFTP